MKAAFWAIAYSLLVAPAPRAETMQMVIVYLSPQVFPATARSLGLEYRLSISAFENPASINHELAGATSEHGFSHEGYFILEDPTTFEPIPLIFVLDVPPYADADDNGIYDFYDRHTAVENVVTEGRHDNGFGGASTFTATWNRPAGDHAGTVTIHLPLLGEWRLVSILLSYCARDSTAFVPAGPFLKASSGLVKPIVFRTALHRTRLSAARPWRDGVTP